MDKRYRPSNSSDGMAFEAEWCENCIKHPISPEAKKQCPHLLKAFCSEDNGKWIWKDGKPVCTAFKSRQEVYRKRVRRVKRDPRQLELSLRVGNRTGIHRGGRQKD